MKPILLTLLLIAGAYAQEARIAPFIKDGKLDLDAAVDHFENLYRSKSSISRSKLVVTRPRRTRELTMKSWTLGEDKALIVIESPAREKGTSTLKVDKNLWNYLPRIKRTIRIPPSMMLSSWMGSDLSNDDLVRETSFREDYTYRLLPPKEGDRGWNISFDAKPGIVGLWKRFELTVSKDGLVPVAARYYDRKGQLARTIAWTGVKEVDGRLVPMKLTLTPTDKEGHKTEMVYLEIKFDVKVSAKTFSLSHLERRK